MTAPILPGAEPESIDGSDLGVLVLHGFTGSPHTMRALAHRFRDAGYSVELPLLAGHGTSVDDMVDTRFADWSQSADAAYQTLSSRCSAVIVVGLSMGGGLALWLAERYPAIVALVLVNPLVVAPGDELRGLIHQLLEAGEVKADGVGSDVAMPGVDTVSYGASPLEAALSLFEGIDGVEAELASVSCPILLLSSREDHVVASESGDRVVEMASGSVERIWLERSFHVATLDYDASVIEAEALRFVTECFEGRSQ